MPEEKADARARAWMETVLADSAGIDAIRRDGKAALAGALALIEQSQDAAATVALLAEAYASPRAHVLGITGPPGVGKSTLINGLIAAWRARGCSVGVIAVDPSSRISRGALLGDRIRMRADPDDQGVFVRSLASRGALGGLSALAYPATVLMRAVYDRVIVETVGVGQSEADIAALADTVMLCVQPGSGDSMQFMKAGIMEIPHIAAVTKADSGPAAARALAELKGALSLAAPRAGTWETRCLLVSAFQEATVAMLLDHVEAHAAQATGSGEREAVRRAQAESWLRAEVLQEFGARGAALLGNALRLDAGESPFAKRRELLARLRLTLD